MNAVRSRTSSPTSGATPEADGGWQTIAPGALRCAPNYPLPRAMTKDDIAEVVQHFQDAARRSSEWRHGPDSTGAVEQDLIIFGRPSRMARGRDSGGDRDWVTLRKVFDPNLRHAAGIANERNHAAVGREARPVL